MKKLFLVFIVLTINGYAQSEAANYKKVVARFQEFYNLKQADSIFAMFSPEVRASMPADKNKEMIVQLQSQLGNLQQTSFAGVDNGVATYKATFAKSVLAMKINVNTSNQLAGLLFDNYKEPAKAEVTVNSTKADPKLGESPFVLKGMFSGDVFGALTMPANTSGKVPVVLIIAGSGPIDRNGNSTKLGINSNSYKLLAEALSKSGIASLRYDKRLVGESVNATKEAQLKFDDYIDDALRMINQLHEDPRFSKVIVLGHSEGSLVGMMAANGQPADAFISVEGAGQPGYFILQEQLKQQPDFISSHLKPVLDSLVRGKPQNNVDASLYAFARPSIQPFLITWMRYDPAKTIKRLKIPVLIIQGNTDLQVGTADADKLKKGKSDAILQVIPNMNYVLKEAPVDHDKNMATYTNPDLPLKAELVSSVIDFVNKLK